MRRKRKGNSKEMNYKKGFKTEDADIQEEKSFKPRFGREKGPKLPTANDPAWYLKNQALASWARTISFNRPAGQAMTQRFQNATTLFDTVSGIATFMVNPTIGIASSPNDAINTNAVRYFNKIRKIVSGSRTYEAPDLMLYTIAAANLYSAYNWAARLYGLTFNFSQQNRYIGDAFLIASGVDPADMRENLADFRLFLNAFAAKISVFAVPATISYFNRVNFLYSGIYADSNTAKAQIYMNLPAYFLKYDSTGSPNGGQLIAEVPDTYVPGTGAGVATVAQIEATLNNLLNAMYYDSDMYTMSGDISKAFEGDLLIANPISEDFNVPVIYDEAVLSQFNNITMFDTRKTNGTAIVTQDASTGILLCSLSYASTLGDQDALPVMNFHKEDISIEDIFEAVPFMLAVESSMSGTNAVYTVKSMGTEWVSEMITYTLKTNGTLQADRFSRYRGITDSQISINRLEYCTLVATILSQFDWAPEVILGHWDDSGTSPYPGTVSGDIYDYDVYQVLDNEQVRRLHDIALWSLFTVE